MRFVPRALGFLACVAVASTAFAQMMSRSGRVSVTTEAKLQQQSNAQRWVQGTLDEAADYDCLTLDGWTYDYIVGGFVSYWGDPAANLPAVNAIYYTDVYVQNISVCLKLAVSPYLVLPANTSLAISTTNPVKCYINGGQTTSGCSQNPPFGTSLSGVSGYSLGVWQLNGSAVLEVMVPVYSKSSTSTTIQSRIDTGGSTNSPFITPSVTLIPGSVAPTISYPQTATTLITDTTARTTVDVYNHYTSGTLYVDIGTTTAYGTTNGGNAIPSTWDSAEYYVDWTGLLPATTYHWRGRFVSNAGSVVYGADRSFTTTGVSTVPAAPTGLRATAVPGMIDVTWSSVFNAAFYRVYRRDAGSTAYTEIGSTTNTIYHDTTAAAGTAHLYRVRAVNASGSSTDSASDLGVMVVYSDEPITSGATTIKATHLSELRTALTGIRTLAGYGTAFTDAAVAGAIVKAVHVNEMRTQYQDAMNALGFRVPPWRYIVTSGVPINAIDFQELRDRMK